MVPSAPVACSKSQSKSAEREPGLLISAVVRAAVILALRGWRSHGSCAEATRPPLGALVPGGARAGQCAVMGGASCDRYSQSLKRSRWLNGKMSQRVKPQACGTQEFSSALGCSYFPLQTYRECAVSILLSSHFFTLQLGQVVPRTFFSHPTAPRSLFSQPTAPGHPPVCVGASSLDSALAEEETFGCKSCTDKFPCKAA